MIVALTIGAIGICALSVIALFMYGDKFEPENCTWYESDMCQGGTKCRTCPILKKN